MTTTSLCLCCVYHPSMLPTQTRRGPPRVCVVYAYHDSETARVNLDFFRRVAMMHPTAAYRVDYYWVGNGATEAEARDEARRAPWTRTFARPNTGYDFCAWSEVLDCVAPRALYGSAPSSSGGGSALASNYTSHHRHRHRRYRYFALVNDTVRGPFLPWWCDAGTTHWLQVFTSLLRNRDVVLAGISINCTTWFNCSSTEGEPHVQSMLLVTNRRGLRIGRTCGALDSSTLDCDGGTLSKCDTIRAKEMGWSAAVLALGLNINCMLDRYRDRDYRRERAVNLLHNRVRGDPWCPGTYFGADVTPYEAVFFKTNRNVNPEALANATAYVLARESADTARIKHATATADSVHVPTSTPAASGAPSTAGGSLADAVLDPDWYLDHYSDLRRNGVRTHAQATAHWQRWGQFEGRCANRDVCQCTNGVGHLALCDRVVDLAPYATAVANRRGLEIGGPSRGLFSRDGALPLYALVLSLDGVNYASDTIWQRDIRTGTRQYRFERLKLAGTQYVAEASALTFAQDGAYDFVLGSRCLEHSANPLKVLAETRRVLAPTGACIYVLPWKHGTFDHRRETSSFAHLLEDQARDTPESNLSHLEEILARHDLRRDPAAGTPEQFRQRSLDNASNRALHQHVFDEALLRQCFAHVGMHVTRFDLVRPYHQIVLATVAPKTLVLENI